MLPPDFDLGQATLDPLEERASAFYDYHKRRLFIMDSSVREAGRLALSHELAHALADQNFYLERYLNHSAGSGDGANARLPVMEGQATWLMMATLTDAGALEHGLPETLLASMEREIEAGAPTNPYSRATLCTCGNR